MVEKYGEDMNQLEEKLEGLTAVEEEEEEE